jgi:hypothetical protein
MQDGTPTVKWQQSDCKHKCVSVHVHRAQGDGWQVTSQPRAVSERKFLHVTSWSPEFRNGMEFFWRRGLIFVDQWNNPYIPLSIKRMREGGKARIHTFLTSSLLPRESSAALYNPNRPCIRWKGGWARLRDCLTDLQKETNSKQSVCYTELL